VSIAAIVATTTAAVAVEMPRNMGSSEDFVCASAGGEEGWQVRRFRVAADGLQFYDERTGTIGRNLCDDWSCSNAGGVTIARRSFPRYGENLIIVDRRDHSYREYAPGRSGALVETLTLGCRQPARS
jgi:hypothetical protein